MGYVIFILLTAALLASMLGWEAANRKNIAEEQARRQDSAEVHAMMAGVDDAF